MTWLAPKLRHRVQIRIPVQTPNDDGGFDVTYTTLITVWAGIKAIKTGLKSFVEHIRGESIANFETHEFRMRMEPIRSMIGSRSFSNGFSSGFNIFKDINFAKSDWFLFVEDGSPTKGRSYRIKRIQPDDERKEYILIRAVEKEEQGSGWPL